MAAATVAPPATAVLEVMASWPPCIEMHEESEDCLSSHAVEPTPLSNNFHQQSRIIGGCEGPTEHQRTKSHDHDKTDSVFADIDLKAVRNSGDDQPADKAVLSKKPRLSEKMKMVVETPDGNV